MRPSYKYPDTDPPDAVRHDTIVPPTVASAKCRTFETGATRDVDESKLDYEGFLSPLVLKRYAEYMHRNRYQADGAVRTGDNWQKGMPFDSYMKSGFRHFMEWWALHRAGNGASDEALCALLFNTMGYLHELLKARR